MSITFQTNIHGLKKAFKTLQPAISKEETRYYLNGICFEKKNDKIHLVATDGHKLICIDVLENNYFSVEGGNVSNSKDFNFIIPRSAIEEFLSPDKIKCAVVSLSFSGGKVTFDYDAGEVIKTYKLIDGTFPEWQKVMPTNTKAFIGFNPRYVQQFCKNLGSSDLIVFECNQEKDAASPASQPQLVRTSMGARLVLMPTRI